jgi:hypothetical protein
MANRQALDEKKVPAKELPVIVRVSVRKAFCFACAVNLITSVGLLAYIFYATDSNLARLTALTGMIVFVAFGSLLQAMFMAAMWEFRIENGLLIRTALPVQQEKLIAEIDAVWNYGIVASARSHLLEIGFLVPGKWLLDNDSRSALVKYSQANIDRTHPLSQIWREGHCSDQR